MKKVLIAICAVLALFMTGCGAKEKNIEGYIFKNKYGQVISARGISEELKKIAKDCSNAEEFKGKVKEEYPEYSGLNYLDMTAGFFFQNK